MGRLTLNVLPSFAQFEPEVTGERIRDKIAASKRKGMWMGGVASLGYDVRERRLVGNPTEAATVRQTFERYLELGSVPLLKEDLDRRDIVFKIRMSKSGTRSGGRSFSRGALYKLLSNPIYIGEIRHRKERRGEIPASAAARLSFPESGLHLGPIDRPDRTAGLTVADERDLNPVGIPNLCRSTARKCGLIGAGEITSA